MFALTASPSQPAWPATLCFLLCWRLVVMSLVISQSIRRAAGAAALFLPLYVSSPLALSPSLSWYPLYHRLLGLICCQCCCCCFHIFHGSSSSSVLFSIDWPLPAAASHSLMYSNVFSRPVSAAGAAAVDGSVIISVLAFSLSPSSPSSHHVID